MTASQKVRTFNDSWNVPSASDVSTPSRILVTLEDAKARGDVAGLMDSLGYQVDAADGAGEALELLRTRRYALIICAVPSSDDARSFLDQSAVLDPDLSILLVDDQGAAGRSRDDATSPPAVTSAAHYDRLSDAVAATLRRHAIVVRQRARDEAALLRLARRDETLKQERQALRMLSVSITETLVNAMETKDQYLRGHSQRVAALAASIAEELGLEPDTVEAVRLAGRLHDVGKIGIREEVMNKPGALTPEEYEHVKQHVRIGMEILTPLKHLGVVLEYAHDHHERWDGTGYPRGRASEEISIGGRILAAADAFDALTSKRAYRDPLTPQETLVYLGENGSGTLLDPQVFGALEAVVHRNKVLLFIDERNPAG
ncbi:MAG TPA: HD domain-containing phosphohydrolase [Gemmatimonadaceae bacterium]|nr:HD domain-containing phosphohydrolase [Gemmatimonadaceae bacterium]